MSKSLARRFFAPPMAVGYGVLTVAGGATTIGLGTATLACAATGIGIIVALPLGALTLLVASGTTYTGSKTGYEIGVAAGSDNHCHSLRHAGAVLSFGAIH